MLHYSEKRIGVLTTVGEKVTTCCARCHVLYKAARRAASDKCLDT